MTSITVGLKRNSRISILALGLVLIFLTNTDAHAEPTANTRNWSIEAGVRYSLLTPSGTMGVSKDNEVKQSDLSDLGLNDAEGTWGLSLGGRYGRPHLFFSGQKSSFTGTGTATKEISQGPITIPAGSVVDTTMDLGIYSVVVTYNLIPGEHKMGLGLGVMGLDFGVSYKEVNTGAQIEIKETYPLPLLALNGSVFWKRIELSALVGGAFIRISGDEVGYLNTDIAARYAFYKGKRFSSMASLGYRYTGMIIDISESTNRFKADIDFTGPYIGLRFKF